MANWAAIGALGTAAQGAGNYFGQVNAQKIKDERLAQARGEFLADRDHTDKRADQAIIDQRAHQKQVTLDTAAAGDQRFTDRMAETQQFKVDNPTQLGANIKGDNGNIWTKDSNGKMTDTGVKFDANEGMDPRFTMTTQVRKEVDKVNGDLKYTESRSGYNKLLELSKMENHTSDASMIFNFMRTLDPESTVREGEFKLMQDAHGFIAKREADGFPVPAVIKQFMQNVTGEGTLLPEQRQQMMEIATASFRETDAAMQKGLEAITHRIEANGLDPRQVGLDAYTFDWGRVDNPNKDSANPYDSMPRGLSEDEFNAWQADKPEVPL